MQKGATNYSALRTALLNEDWDAVPKNLTAMKSLEAWSKGKFKINGDKVSFNGEELPSKLRSRILGMVGKGEDPSTIFKFWERLQKNPSYRSVNQLWDFLEHRKIPLTKDGCFLAYKSVKQDYTDHHSGTVSNKPGTTNEMPRNQISDDPAQTCDPGFHVGAIEYARGQYSNGRIVICKIDPEHVVSVPNDHSAQKMRVCKYTVVGHHGEDLSSTVHDEDIEEAVEEEDDVKTVTTVPVKDREGKPTGTSTSTHIKKANKGYAKYDKMDMTRLMECSLDDLRQYAGKGLDIVGASKIAGGKTALVVKILEVRG